MCRGNGIGYTAYHAPAPRTEWLMRLRLLIYMVGIWESEYRQLGSRETESQQPWSPILPIVFYTGSERWAAPIPLTEIFNVPQVFERFVPAFETLFLDVKQTGRETADKDGASFWVVATGASRGICR